MDKYHECERRMFCFMCMQEIFETNSQGVEICPECERLQDERLQKFAYRFDSLPQEHGGS